VADPRLNLRLGFEARDVYAKLISTEAVLAAPVRI
jgi:hypothetical protein